MIIKEYDKVLLRTGEMAVITDVLKSESVYVADIDKKDGSIQSSFVDQADIKQLVLEKY